MFNGSTNCYFQSGHKQPIYLFLFLMLKIKYTCIVLSWLASFLFVSWFYENVYSEQVWFMDAARISDSWNTHVRKEGKACIILAGGSEVRTRYDPRILLDEFSICAINAAEHAGYGMACNAALALQYAQPGDCLLMSYSIGIKTSNCQPTSLGISALRERLRFRVFQDGIIPISSKNLGMLFKGKSREFSGALHEICSGSEPYWSYPKSVIHASGWMEVRMYTVKEQQRAIFNPGDSLSLYDSDPYFIDFVHRLQTACQKRKVKLVWFVTPQFANPDMRVRRIWEALALTRLNQNVLKDEELGVNTDITCFADTDRHPTAAAAAKDTRHLGIILQRCDFWSEEELVQCLNLNGYSAVGKRK